MMTTPVPIADAPVVDTAGVAPLEYSRPIDERRVPARIAWGVILFFSIPFVRFLVQLAKYRSESTHSSWWMRDETMSLVFFHLADELAVGFLLMSAIRFLYARRTGNRMLFYAAVGLLVVASLDALAEMSWALFWSWFDNESQLVWTALDGACAVAAAAIPPVVLLLILKEAQAVARVSDGQRRV